jgi:hypothetical protein
MLNRSILTIMRKVPALALICVLSVSALTPASAASRATSVTAAFKTLLSTTVDSLDALEEKYESEIDALDASLAEATRVANSTYDSEFSAAALLYSPQISAINAKISEAKTKFVSVSSIKVLNLGTFRSYWGNFNCPTARPECIDTDKGPKFIVGEITTIKEFLSTTYTDSLPEIDIMVSLGLIELQKPAEYLAVASTIKNEPANIKSLTAKFSDAQTVARNKQSRTISAAKTARDSALANLDEAYETAKAELEAQEAAANLALLAAKRATKDTANFDAAFVVAYKFEYNRQMIGEIADSAWTGEWTFRTIDTIIEVNRLARTGDQIGAKYSRTAAAAFNSAVGNAFTNEPNFRAALKVLTAIYKKTTKTTLRF